MTSSWLKSSQISLAVLLLATATAPAGQGNGLPPGARFMLNVIAFDAGHCPAGDFTDSSRHMIAVQADFTPDGSGNLGTTQAGISKDLLIRSNTIGLTQGPDFHVVDGNACSKGGAEMVLPTDPFVCDTDGDGRVDANLVNDPSCIGEDLTFQEYRVFVRLVGKPGTGIGVTSCATENSIDLNGDGVVDDTVLCSTENVVRVRSKTAKFEDVTRQLL